MSAIALVEYVSRFDPVGRHEDGFSTHKKLGISESLQRPLPWQHKSAKICSDWGNQSTLVTSCHNLMRVSISIIHFVTECISSISRFCIQNQHVTVYCYTTTKISRSEISIIFTIQISKSNEEYKVPKYVWTGEINQASASSLAAHSTSRHRSVMNHRGIGSGYWECI
jgi:hypothetical protein